MVQLKRPLKFAACTRLGLTQESLSRECQKYWFAATLIRVVDDLDILLKLFLSVLLEKSVIVVGNNLKEVTGLVMGLK